MTFVVNIRSDERKLLVKNTAQFVLYQTLKKIPIKRADVVRECLRGELKLFDPIFAQAKEILEEVYGLSLVEIKDDKNAKFYLGISLDPAASDLEVSYAQRNEMRLLFIVLSFIYMKHEPVLEATLMAFLRRLDIEGEQHEVFGNIPKMIGDKFVKQMYLKKEKIVLETNNNDEQIQYTWGYRAELEFEKKGLFEFVAEIFNKPKETFSTQYIEIFGEELEGDVELMDVEE